MRKMNIFTKTLVKKALTLNAEVESGKGAARPIRTVHFHPLLDFETLANT